MSRAPFMRRRGGGDVRSNQNGSDPFAPSTGPGADAIDLAIDAIEIANLIRIQIHTHRNPLAPPADDRIDEPVFLKPAGMLSVQCCHRHSAEPAGRPPSV